MKFIENVSRKAKMFVLSTCVMAMMAIPAFAEESTPDVQSALTTAFNGVKASVTSTVLTALPIALGIFAMVFGIKYAIRFFKKIANA
ncbi:MAG: hypothetical protein GX488_11070 [Clostridiales bacterium]|nr:hypothetical protein [Clostridiales bacterium]